MKNQIEEKAIESFRSGLNCAQAVVSSYSEVLDFDKEMALHISCGFGGGMGRLQGTCGAVTGSYMVLGIHNCSIYADNIERKAATYEMVQQFNEKFLEANGATDCMALLNCEIKSDAGHQKAKDNKLFVTVCEKCISDSIGIINKLIGQSKDSCLHPNNNSEIQNNELFYSKKVCKWYRIIHNSYLTIKFSATYDMA